MYQYYNDNELSVSKRRDVRKASKELRKDKPIGKEILLFPVNESIGSYKPIVDSRRLRCVFIPRNSCDDIAFHQSHSRQCLNC